MTNTANAEVTHLDDRRPDAIWQARPALEHIERAARSGLASPWAVLGVALVNVAATVPPHITLPPLIGGPASLNYFAAIVGGSGLGKGAAVAVADRSLSYPMTAPRRPLGSGEGMARAIGHQETIETQDGAKLTTTVIDEPSIVFEASEVDQLAALTGRTGATLMPQLRSAWSGEQLGASYAAREKAVIIGAHDYRLGLILGVQPRRAAALLDEQDGGTPQRFGWFHAADPDARAGLRWPGVREVPKIDWPLSPSCMEIPATAEREIVGNRLRVLHGHGQALDGHAQLTRLKTAALLAVLDGRTDVDEDDWRLAGLVSEHSRQAREVCVRAVREVEIDAAKQRAETRAHAEDAHEQTREALNLERVARSIETKLADGQPKTRGTINRLLAGRDRHLTDLALTKLVTEKRIAFHDDFFSKEIS